MKQLCVVALIGMVLWAGPAFATPQQRCDAARVRAWGAYVSCVDKVVAKKADKGVSLDWSAVFPAFAKCRHAYFKKWATLQAKRYAGSTCVGNRYVDNSDGTVTDNLTTLVWEQKTEDATVHDKGNMYTWSTDVPYVESGTAFTTFLSSINGGGGFAGANGWRLPTLAELQTIVADFACTGAWLGSTCNCASSPCVALDAANTQPSAYWSATSDVSSSLATWLVDFGNGEVIYNPVIETLYVRAVRGGL